MYNPLLFAIKKTQKSYTNPLILSIKSMKNELANIDTLYVHSKPNKNYIFFYLNAYTKGKATIYKKLEDIRLGKNDAIITLNRDELKSFRKNESYQLIKKGKNRVSLFKKK